jgi:hypothetical protein
VDKFKKTLVVVSRVEHAAGGVSAPKNTRPHLERRRRCLCAWWRDFERA